jgi:chaperonin cofactor prefoldin
MTAETQPVGHSASGSRLGRTARSTAGCLLRLLFIVILGIGLGAAIYYGVVYGAPALYYQYVYPVQQNTLRLEDLEARQAQSDQQLAARLDAMQARLEALEIQGDTDRETFSTLQSGLDAIATSLTGVQAAQAEAQVAIDDLLAAQAAIGASSEGIQAAQAEAKAHLGEAQGALDDLAQQVAGIDEQVESLLEAARQSDEKVAALQGELQAVSLPVADLQYEQHLLRALDQLTRAELHLAQGNAGLARSDVAVARALLSDLQTQLPVRYQDAMAAILTRLDLVLGNLPGATDLARNDLDVAWQLLLWGMTGTRAEEGLTLVPTLTIASTPTLTVTAVVTPTETITP